MPNGPDWLWVKAQGIQESRLDPQALSSVGAKGIMQVMPATWAEIQKAMGWRGISPYSAPHSIFGGTWYQSRMARMWWRQRTVPEAYDLGLASYNAGAGTILKAQALCQGAHLWGAISPCLSQVSGAANARQTTDYVRRIAAWHALLEAK
jgi:soluble lytic murein transglycosylase-like protein